MKKLLGILVLGLLWCNVGFANDKEKIRLFNEWLFKNGYHQYLNFEQKAACKDEPKYSNHWYNNG